MKNTNLQLAKNDKNDEFYTLYQTIDDELKHYTPHFENKIVYCNCDVIESNFTKYFLDNFHSLKLKKMICTTIHTNQKFVYDGIEEKIEYLNEAGDFRSPECVKLLGEADIIVTNPPFSLFREYLAILMKHGKKFLILGNLNAVAYKEVFPFIKENRMRYGVSIHCKNTWFEVPKECELRTKNFKIEKDGSKLAGFGSIRWFTNLDSQKHHEPLILCATYSPDKYPKYDTCDAIEVSKVKLIPKDYSGLMGVPITFLDKYCPEQFEIIGLDRYVENNTHYGKRFEVNGKEIYARILIKRRTTSSV